MTFLEQSITYVYNYYRVKLPQIETETYCDTVERVAMYYCWEDNTYRIPNDYKDFVSNISSCVAKRAHIIFRYEEL